MKRITLLSLFLFVGYNTLGQQVPFFSQYFNSLQLINPASVGVEDFIDIKVGATQQFSSLTGNPQTGFVTGSFPINRFPEFHPHLDSMVHIPIHLHLPAHLREHLQARHHRVHHSKPTVKHGFGFQLISDRIGNLSNTGFYGSYSVHKPLGKLTSVSFGVSLGAQSMGYPLGKLIAFEANDPNYTSITSRSQVLPDMNIGIIVYTGNFYLGVSAVQLLALKTNFMGRQERHYFVTAGYKHYVGTDLALMPSIIYGGANGKPLYSRADFNLRAEYKDLFWLGTSVRKNFSMSYMAGLSLLEKKLDVSFNFDPDNQLDSQLGTSQAIMASYKIGGSTKARSLF